MQLVAHSFITLFPAHGGLITWSRDPHTARATLFRLMHASVARDK